MGFRVAFATSTGYPELHPDDRLTYAPLQERGIAIDVRIWSDPDVPWQHYDAVVVRSCWDYFEHVDAFRAWLLGLERQGVRLFNPAPVILGNMDKLYLRDLAARGAEILETAWLSPSEANSMPEFLAGLPWQDVVVKPAVSAGAFRTVRTTKARLLADPTPLREVLSGSTALVQPYVEEIERQGEWSFLFFGEAFSHAVVKTPKPGDFRVQWRHGGTHAQVTPSSELRAQVERIRALLPAGRLYTRIDGVVVQERFKLIEVELIEPYLFFAEDPASAARFADALAGKLNSPT